MENRMGRFKILLSLLPLPEPVPALLKSASAEIRRENVALFGRAGDLPPEINIRLNQLTPLRMNSKDEFDLPGTLLGSPDLLLLPDLAHKNPQDMKNPFRYMDALELVQNGIDVYTTLSLGEIEPLKEDVEKITGIHCASTVPASVFDGADEIEFAKEADISEPRRSALLKLRLGLLNTREKKRALQGNNNGQDHILVCLSSSPSNKRIIRTAARMAKAFSSPLTALFVETPSFAYASKENRLRLQENLKLARQLGAVTRTVYGEDIPYQIAEFARLSGVTRIVIGRSARIRSHPIKRQDMNEILLGYLPSLEMHIIPDVTSEVSFTLPSDFKMNRSILINTLKSAGILAGETMIASVFHRIGFTEPNIIMVYILGVLLTSIVTSHLLYSLISSIASVFIFNYLFTVPRFSFTAYGTGYPVTFVIMFITALITGTFAMRYKEQAAQSARLADRTKHLFDTNQLLFRASGRDEIIYASGRQMEKLLNRGILIFMFEKGELIGPLFASIPVSADPEGELEKARFAGNKAIIEDKGGEGFFYEGRIWLTIRLNEEIFGLVGIDASKGDLQGSEYDIILSILGETALALENEKNEREKEAAAILARSEQLRADLLRTISHDLRTPLTTISGNASNLLDFEDSFDTATRHQIYQDIYDDSLWLTSLVENLLHATSIEEGRMVLRASPELIEEIVEETKRHLPRRDSHPVRIVYEDEMLLVHADARLIVHVLSNLIDNAFKYSPDGSPITVSVKKCGNMAMISVADEGEGIPAHEKEKIFEMFYRSDDRIADNRRSLGLGLYLCRSIVEAHGGIITVTDNQPKGSIFCFTLPLEEIQLYE